jgi:hypothetical protein
MSLLNFLKKANVEEVKSSPAARTGGGVRKQWNPNPAIVAVRVWKDGSVFPSQAAVDKFDLEYRKAKITKEALPLKDGQAEAAFKNKYEFPEGTGNGLDVIDTREWAQYKGDGDLLFVAVVPKDAGKVDLFSSVNYDAEGAPKVTAMEQGANTFGKEVLVPAIEAVYGIKFQREAKAATKESAAVTAQEGVDFVDLEIFETFGEGEDAVNVTEAFSKPILHVPKRITRGADKGKSDYTRRENVKVYGFAPTQVLHPEKEAEIAAESHGTDEAVDLTDASMEERNRVLAGE